MTDLLSTPLLAWHQAAGAKLASFGGWLMPLEYRGVLAEHRAVRTAVGLFDVSHLGKIRLRGAGAVGLVQKVCTNDLEKITDGRSQYTLCCAENGGVIDDLMSYRLTEEHLLLMPNAANANQVWGQLQAANQAGVRLSNDHQNLGVLAIQGPASRQVLAAMGWPTDLAYLDVRELSWRGQPVLLCRTGYTGEVGFEVLPPWAATADLWSELVAIVQELAGAVCGLAARDTLRTEMGYPLHGQDLTREITPAQAGLNWAVGWSKPEFIGRTALLAERELGPKRRLVGLKLSARGVPRPGQKIFPAAPTESTTALGQLTTGTFSPTLGCGIALAQVIADLPAGSEVLVDIRGRRVPAVVTRPPFVDRRPQD